MMGIVRKVGIFPPTSSCKMYSTSNESGVGDGLAIAQDGELLGIQGFAAEVLLVEDEAEVLDFTSAIAGPRLVFPDLRVPRKYFSKESLIADGDSGYVPIGRIVEHVHRLDVQGT